MISESSLKQQVEKGLETYESWLDSDKEVMNRILEKECFDGLTMAEKFIIRYNIWVSLGKPNSEELKKRFLRRDS